MGTTMKLSEIKLIESVMSELHLEAQERIMDLLGLGDDDAEAVMDWATGVIDFEDLSDKARERLYSHYEKVPGMDAEHAADPKKFILPALKKDIKL